MAKARLKTLTDLRRVRVDSQTLMVYRCGKYVIGNYKFFTNEALALCEARKKLLLTDISFF